MLEIGPGMGVMTEKLLEKSKFVFAVEIDKLLSKYLREKFKDKENFLLINNDILKFDFKDLTLNKKKLVVVGNLPYYISSPIVEKIIDNRSVIRDSYVTIQKEFGQRMAALPGTKDYGSLSLFVQYFLNPEYLFTIKRNSFYPVPDVDSVFLRLLVPDKPNIYVKNEEVFFKIVRGSFSKRRKKLINSIPFEKFGITKDMFRGILKDVNISPELRPEDLNLSDFARISDKIAFFIL